MKTPNYRLLIGMLVLLMGAGCSSLKDRLYYGTMEKFGYEKREVLSDRVVEARDAQQETKEEIVSALEAFKKVVAFEGGELEDLYNELQDQYDRIQGSADNLSDHIDSVQSVAEALLREWEDELDEYSSAELRRASEERLRETRSRYEDLIQTMRRAEERMYPVLDAFQDQVLFLKHNLNARAIDALENEVVVVEREVDRLVEQMEEAIAKAEAFIAEMEK